MPVFLQPRVCYTFSVWVYVTIRSLATIGLTGKWIGHGVENVVESIHTRD